MTSLLQILLFQPLIVSVQRAATFSLWIPAFGMYSTWLISYQYLNTSLTVTHQGRYWGTDCTKLISAKASKRTFRSMSLISIGVGRWKSLGGISIVAHEARARNFWGHAHFCLKPHPIVGPILTKSCTGIALAMAWSLNIVQGEGL